MKNGKGSGASGVVAAFLKAPSNMFYFIGVKYSTIMTVFIFLLG